MTDTIERAERLADELFFPAASEVDTTGVLPAGHLDRLAAKGFYGLMGPAGADGSGPADPTTAARVVEVLAGGCLATTFVWTQHHSAVGAVARSDRPELREEWLEPLCRGRRRAGVALGALRPGPPSVRATAVPGGYRLDGAAPWVTGWGMIDVLYTAARDESDTALWLLVDATPGHSLRVRPLDLAAVDASGTVGVTFDGLVVPAERLAATLPYADWPARDAGGLRTNGSFALGVAGRCVRLLDPLQARDADGLDGELAECRARLDTATPETVAQARAAASELAVRAASTLVVASGAGAVLRDHHAQRLLREAMFLLVFGSRPAIRTALLERIRRHPTDS